MWEWGFLVKKLIAAFCMPLPLLVLMLCLAGLLYWRKKFLLAKCLGVFSALFFYLISIQITSDILNSNLENQYSSYQKAKNNSADYVLVLGSYHISDKSQPISSLLSSAGLMRLVEGIRVYRLNPGSKLLLSGYNSSDEISHGQYLKRVPRYSGVAENEMNLACEGQDNRKEANK